ncbi:hypothetical protein JW859_09265 [bacterium]|nr:hypothetical protein [bacterium]
MSEERPAARHSRYERRVLDELERLMQQTRPGCTSVHRLTRTKKDRLIKRIDRAGIAVLLAADPNTACRIYDHVPVQLRGLLLGPRPKTIEEVTRLVASNLGWYLEPTRTLLRAEWWQMILSALVLLFCTVWLLLLFMGIVAFNSFVLLIIPIALGIWYFAFADTTRAAWVEALHAHLCAVYYPDFAEHPAAGSAKQREGDQPGDTTTGTSACAEQADQGRQCGEME